MKTCRDCEFYRFHAEAEENFRFCVHEDILVIDKQMPILTYARPLLASEARDIPEWCPLGK